MGVVPLSNCYGEESVFVCLFVCLLSVLCMCRLKGQIMGFVPLFYSGLFCGIMRDFGGYCKLGFFCERVL